MYLKNTNTLILKSFLPLQLFSSEVFYISASQDKFLWKTPAKFLYTSHYNCQ